MLSLFLAGCVENDRAEENGVQEVKSFSPGFEERKVAYFSIDFPHAHYSKEDVKFAIPYALIALERSGGQDAEAAAFISEALDPANREINVNPDKKFDVFVMTNVVRALINFPHAFSSEQLAQIERFTRLYSEYAGGGTENHRLMRWASGYYFVQRFGGEWKHGGEVVSSEAFLAIIKGKLMDEFRFRMDNGGMSEFLSPNYLTHHIYPIMSLVETCEDPELQNAAKTVAMLHLTHLALNVHDGYILEPHARSGSTQFTGSNVRSANGSQYLSWILWGTFDPGLPRLTSPREQAPVAGPFLCDWSVFDHYLYELANGDGVVPFSGRSAAMNWPHSGDNRKPRTTLRSFYRGERYAIGAGYQKHVPEGFYLQHSIWGMTWSSANEAAFVQCGHNYWYADEGDRNIWRAPASPFQQMVHHENSTLMLFNVPTQDPWPGMGRSDWASKRDEVMVDYAMVRFPSEITDRVWKRNSDGSGDTLFLNDNGVFVAIRSLTPLQEVGIDSHFRGLRSVPQKTGRRSQSAFFFHVGTDFEYPSFEAFQAKVLEADVDIDWGEGGNPVPSMSVVDPDGDVLSLTFNGNMEPNEEDVVENLPEVVINGESLDYSTWPDMEGPSVLLRDGVLRVNGADYSIED